MDLLEIAKRPAVSIGPGATVLQACEEMTRSEVGALVVIEGEHLVGLISERDIVTRVVVKSRDPSTTAVGDIMTRAVRTANAGMSLNEALEVMHHGRFRHLPLVDESGAVVGMLSVRNLLRARVADLDLKNANLVTYISADGPGG